MCSISPLLFVIVLGSRSKSRRDKKHEESQSIQQQSLETTIPSLPVLIPQTPPSQTLEEKETNNPVTNVRYIREKLNGLSTRFDGFEDELNMSKNVSLCCVVFYFYSICYVFLFLLLTFLQSVLFFCFIYSAQENR